MHAAVVMITLLLYSKNNIYIYIYIHSSTSALLYSASNKMKLHVKRSFPSLTRLLVTGFIAFMLMILRTIRITA